MSIVDLNSSEFKPWLNPNVNQITAKTLNIDNLTVDEFSINEKIIFNNTPYTGGDFFFENYKFPTTWTFEGGVGTSTQSYVYMCKIGNTLFLQTELFSVTPSGGPPSYIEMDSSFPIDLLPDTVPTNGQYQIAVNNATSGENYVSNVILLGTGTSIGTHYLFNYIKKKRTANEKVML